jgi:hypothetical protein
MTRIARIVTVVVSLVVLAGSIYGITHRQEILDYLALRNYTPNQRIVQLANETAMQEQTRRVFYINHPDLNNKTQFRQNCPATEQSIVLGCYVENQGIYLLDVTDERLSGVIQVTAAHEVLHAEYDRLSRSERENVDKMTADFFKQVTNERVKRTVEQYRSKDPSIVPGELHSILGTEVRNLSPELEAYYSQYFSDRSKIVSYSENYEQTFVDLSDQVEDYDGQLQSLKETIESNRVEIEGQSSEIERQKSRLDSLLASGQTEEYNASVPAFNAEVNSYNRLLQRTKSLIAEYNEIVERRNDIATTEQELVEAINSNVVPQAH